MGERTPKSSILFDGTAMRNYEREKDYEEIKTRGECDI